MPASCFGKTSSPIKIMNGKLKTVNGASICCNTQSSLVQYDRSHQARDSLSTLLIYLPSLCAILSGTTFSSLNSNRIIGHSYAKFSAFAESPTLNQHNGQSNGDAGRAFDNSSDTPNVFTTTNNEVIIETPSRIAACTVQISAEKKQSTPNDQTNTIQGLSTHLARNFNKKKSEQQTKDDMKYYSKHNQIIQLGDQHQRNTQQPNQDNGYELNGNKDRQDKQRNDNQQKNDQQKDESDEEEDIAGDDEKQGEEASGDARRKKKILCKIKAKQRIMEG